MTTDDEYNGYRLPAGAVVIGNTWWALSRMPVSMPLLFTHSSRAILHDEESYPDPFSFKPERFIKDGKLNPEVQDPEVAAFGFGRRICPGRHMATATIWMAVASILAAFKITKAIDEDGNIIEPSGEYSSGLGR